MKDDNYMLGAIVGDIVGSVYEWHNIKTKDFPLFRDDCHFTDDTVMTCAVAEAVMRGGERNDFIDSMKRYGRMYPNAGYGARFKEWIFSDVRKPYNSFGNGSAMRVSPCAWVVDCSTCERLQAQPKGSGPRDPARAFRERPDPQRRPHSQRDPLLGRPDEAPLSIGRSEAIPSSVKCSVNIIDSAKVRWKTMYMKRKKIGSPNNL